MSLYSYKYQPSQTLATESDQRIRKILIRAVAALSSLFLVLFTTLLLNIFNTNYASPISAQTSQEEQQPINNHQSTMEQSNNETITLTTTPYQLDTTWNQDGISENPQTPIPKILSPTPYPLHPIPYPLNPTKSLYTIAIIGDSMVDTMGEVLEYLDEALKKKYPTTRFLLYNYGTGAQNVEVGLNRFATHFGYQTRNYPPLPELKPDILIVASFAYNPFTPHDRDRHWLKLAELVKTAQTVSPNVYLLAEIAPLRADFGKGPQGVNWSNETNYEHSGRIIEQLQNAVGLSRSLNVPLIDAFTPSFNSTSQEGNRAFVNPADGIHPSVEGHRLMAEKIAEAFSF